MPPQIHVVPHSPTWASKFAAQKSHLATLLSPVLPPTAYRIEHVGSTSVPTLPAKPVLDIDIIVPGPYVDIARARLVEAGGYLDLGELGIAGRWVMRQPGFAREDQAGLVVVGEGDGDGEKEMRVNTYVVLEGGNQMRNHLDVKRVLLEHEDLRREYGDVKMALVGRTGDLDEYVRGKNEIVLRILERAGWSEGELEVVRKANE